MRLAPLIFQRYIDVNPTNISYLLVRASGVLLKEWYDSGNDQSYTFTIFDKELP